MSSLAPVSVLVVDDNRAMRSITATVLSGLGVGRIYEAPDGERAFEMLRTEPIDLVVVDYKMAPMNGIEFVRLVRNHPGSACPYIPIIMLTGHADRSRVLSARDAGVTEFMVKPITARALTDRIQTMIMKPRPFLRTASYFGPDRRRRNRPADEGGPRRRAEDAPST